MGSKVRQNRDDGADLRLLAPSESLQSSFKLLKTESTGTMPLYATATLRAGPSPRSGECFGMLFADAAEAHKLKAAEPGFDLHIGACARNMKPLSKIDIQDRRAAAAKKKLKSRPLTIRS
jgi:hypothetical protein